MSKRIILFISSLAVVLGLMATSGSYAWFATSAGKKQTISVLTVSNVHSAYLADLDAPYHTVIMPGDNLVSLDGNSAMLQLENKSTADSQLRICVKYTSYQAGSAEEVTYSGSDTDDIVVEFAPGMWSKHINSSGVCYFYYVGDEYKGDTLTTIDQLPVISPSEINIPAISSISYKDDISAAYSGQPVNVRVIFESKQADKITWSAIDAYDVSGVAE